MPDALKRKPPSAPAASDATDSSGGGKRPRVGDDHPASASGASGKEDLFDAHNFDIELDMGGAGVGLPASVVAASVADDDDHVRRSVFVVALGPVRMSLWPSVLPWYSR
jgi:hypothetical protein